MTLIRSGELVGSSEAALLTKLDIRPFSYGLLTKKIFDDGIMYDPKILDLSDSDVEAAVTIALENLAALSLELHTPTLAVIPQTLTEGFKNVLAIITHILIAERICVSGKQHSIIYPSTINKKI